MTFAAEVDPKPFADAMAKAARIVDKKGTIPILSHALLTVDQGQLTIRSTNFDQAITLTLAADGGGSITASAEKLAQFAAHADGGKKITLKTSGTLLTLTQGALKLTLPTLPAADAPDLTLYDAPAGIDWRAPTALLDHLKVILGAAATNHVRRHLCGVHLHFGADASVVATNAHILARDRITHLSPPSEDYAAIIPAEAVPHLAAAMTAGGDFVWRLAANRIAASREGITIASQLIDDTYPDYNRVIPTRSKWRIRIERDIFIRLLDRVGIVNNASADSLKTRATRLIAKDGELIAEVANTDGEKSTDACAANITGAVDIAFNMTYLRWTAASLPAGEIELAGEDHATPAIVTAAADPAPEPHRRARVRVVMPMKA